VPVRLHARCVAVRDGKTFWNRFDSPKSSAFRLTLLSDLQSPADDLADAIQIEWTYALSMCEGTTDRFAQP